MKQRFGGGVGVGELNVENIEVQVTCETFCVHVLCYFMFSGTNIIQLE